jgi:LysM repeat protein
VAGDFEGTEVICPACHEKLKLPVRPDEVPPLVVTPPQAPDQLPIQTVEPDEHADPDFRSLATSRQGRRKLLIALGVPLLVAITAYLLLPGKKSNEPAPKLTVQAEPAPVVESEPPATEAVAAPAVEDTSPEVLEIPVESPTSDPVVAAQPSPPAASETPAEIPAQDTEPNPEQGLVAAIPDTPANRLAAAPPAAPAESAATTESAPPVEPAAPTEAAPPAQPVESAAPAAPAATAENAPIHTVARGDTLTKIAGIYQVDVATIRQANGMKTDRLLAGQLLKIPGGTARAVQDAQSPAPEPSAPVATRHHTVVRGDTLGKIARKYGVAVADIMRANGMKNDVVRLGAKLVIPAAPQ